MGLLAISVPTHTIAGLTLVGSQVLGSHGVSHHAPWGPRGSSGILVGPLIFSWEILGGPLGVRGGSGVRSGCP